MIKYYPLDIGIAFKANNSDLVNFHWETNRIWADFRLPGYEGSVIRVTFDNQCIVRIIDEMPLSTESDPADWEGLIPDHFAYLVEGAAFMQMQSITWKEITGARHYQFCTGWACLDVISAAEPTFEVLSSALTPAAE
ncbi:hypothetical protein VPG91_07540 [Nitrospirillum amazonense]|uniref:hypothetical protein n=1 Tax=Nitrospirillum amazonense TaxID=28077 RepID=UPI002DD44D1B|nr:hypothetical protein [Nitrospirillum amazonense]MEC4590835.1 hypothetical protein [Nitrospirillum amazonense]